MTFDQVMKSDKVMLTTHDVGTAIGISPMRLMAQARKAPEKLGFPVVVACDTVRIPRVAFIEWVLGRAGAEAARGILAGSLFGDAMYAETDDSDGEDECE